MHEQVLLPLADDRRHRLARGDVIVGSHRRFRAVDGKVRHEPLEIAEDHESAAHGSSFGRLDFQGKARRQPALGTIRMAAAVTGRTLPAQDLSPQTPWEQKE